MLDNCEATSLKKKKKYRPLLLLLLYIPSGFLHQFLRFLFFVFCFLFFKLTIFRPVIYIIHPPPAFFICYYHSICVFCLDSPMMWFFKKFIKSWKCFKTNFFFFKLKMKKKTSSSGPAVIASVIVCVYVCVFRDKEL